MIYTSTPAFIETKDYCLSQFPFFFIPAIQEREREKMMLPEGLAVVVALTLTWVTTCSGAPSPPPPSSTYIPTGREKDAWPELLHLNVNDAVAALTASGLVQNVYVQPPSFGPAPADRGLSSDVWIYTDGSTVYETPKRGVWHPNRLIPGWTELSGMGYKSTIAKIKEDYCGVTVIYGPKSSLVRTSNIQMDRVFVEINNNSMVVGVPFIG